VTGSATLDDVGKVYRDLRSLLFAIAYRMLSSAGEAEDIVQEAFVRFQRATGEGILVESPRAWLSAVVTREGPLGVLVLHEPPRVRRDVAVRHADDRQVVAPVLRPRVGEERELLATRVAPRCPEVHDHGAAAVVRQFHGAVA